MKKLNNYFDKIYCINLDRRPDRWEKVNRIFNELKLNVERFPAVDGKTLANDNATLSNAEMGCVLSHIGVYKRALHERLNNILIFEDDIIPHIRVDELFQKKKDIINNFDVTFLGSNQGHFNILNISNDYRSNNATWGGFAYSINEKAMKFILDMKTYNIPIDGILNKMNAVVLYPQLFIADVSDSDIREARDINILSKQRGWNLKNYMIDENT